MNGFVVILAVIPFVFAAKIQLLDITPEEAQRLITQQSLDLRYATKLSEGPVSAGRSYNGKVVDDDPDYTEETYEANQFHGADGLGRAIFGYTDNQQARLEARNVNGEVRGQYQYLDPWGNDIQVQYWSDSLGFHHTDNIPKFVLEPVTDTPEVKAAREEHLRLWNEAAKLTGVDVDSNNDLYNRNAVKNFDDSQQDLEGQLSVQSNDVRYPTLPYKNHITPNNLQKSFGKINEDSVIVDAAASETKEVRARNSRQNVKEQNYEDVTSEPRGFFYSFDYAVPVVVNNAEKSGEAAASEHQIRYLKPEEGENTSKISEDINSVIVPIDVVESTNTSRKQKQRLTRGSVTYKKRSN